MFRWVLIRPRDAQTRRGRVARHADFRKGLDNVARFGDRRRKTQPHWFGDTTLYANAIDVIFRDVGA